MVNDQSVLRCIFDAVRPHRRDTRIVRRHAKQLVPGGQQLFVTQIGLVEQLHIEAGCVAKFQHRRRLEGDDQGVPRSPEMLHHPPGHRRPRLRSQRTIGPGLEADSQESGILPLPGEIEPHDRESGDDIILLLRKQVIDHALVDRFGLFRGGPGRQCHLAENQRLILVRQKARRHLREQHHHATSDDHEGQHRPDRTGDHPPDAAGVASVRPVESLVEPGERSPLFGLPFQLWLQQARAQRRRQDERHQDRQHHRGNDRHRELAVDHARRAAQERHRQEHGRQDQSDADQRTGDLRHGFSRRVPRRELVLLHDALDVLDHHDGVVHQQADGKDHRQHGQRVDGVAQHRQHPERAQQHDGNRDGRDQRRAEVLQEDVHDHEHQRDRLDQRFDHLLDRKGDERLGVERVDDLQPGREESLQARQLLADGGFRRQLVGARGQLQRETARRGVVVLGRLGVGLRAQLDPGHVLQQDLRAVEVDLQQDVFELANGFIAAWPDDRGVQSLALAGRQATQLARGYLDVLLDDGVRDVANRDRVFVELARIEPDPHRIFGAEQRVIANAGNPAQRVLNIGSNIVVDVLSVHAAVGRDEADDHHEVPGGLGDADALRGHLRRQHRLGQGQLVLHLNLGNVDVRALLERQVDLHRAAGLRGRGDVF